MVRLFTDQRMLDHVPPARHPERPERLRAILRHLERVGLSEPALTGSCDRPPTRSSPGCTDPSTSTFVAVDTSRPGWIRSRQTPGSAPARHLAARLAAGAAVEAVAWSSRNRIGGRSASSGRPATMPGRGNRWASASSATSPSPRPTPATARARPGPDRRLRRPPRQRHAGDLLQTTDGSGSSRSIAIPFYPGTGPRTRPGPGRASDTRATSRCPTARPGRDTTPPSAAGLERWRTGSDPSSSSSAPGSTPMPRTRSATWGSRSRTSRPLTTRDRRRGRDARPGPDRQRPRRGLQRSDPRRLRRGPPAGPRCGGLAPVRWART